MLALDKRAARYTWTAAAVLLLLVLVYLMRKTLFVFVVALLFGYLLSPLVDLLDRVLPASRTRTPALLLAYLILLGILIGGGMVIGSRVVEEATSLNKELPALIAKWEQPTPGASPTVNSFKQQILETIQREVVSSSSNLVAVLPRAGLKFLSLASDLIYIVIVPILAFFFLKDGREIRHAVLGSIESHPRRALIDDLMADVHLLLAHYMRALFLLSLATLISYSVAFTAMGVPYSLLLGVLAAVLEFIPMIGPLAAAVIVIVVGGISGASVLAMLIFIGCYRLFQDYVLSPHVMGAGVEMHPLLVLFGVFAGAEIAGVPGAFLSVPILALARILYRRMRRARTVTELSPVTTP